MPALTRRRDPDVAQETWRIHYGDVVVGTLARCVGNPGATSGWEWRCGFYPGSRPGECTGGNAADFDQARATFETAWCIFLSKRTEADFQAWRDQRDWTRRSMRHGRQVAACLLNSAPMSGLISIGPRSLSR
jgi:hypothetical protein